MLSLACVEEGRAKRALYIGFRRHGAIVRRSFSKLGVNKHDSCKVLEAVRRRECARMLFACLVAVAYRAHRACW